MRTMRVMCMGAIAVLALAACSQQESAAPVVAAQCGMDTDCKGDRICDAGVCRAPDAVQAVVAPVEAAVAVSEPAALTDSIVQRTLSTAIAGFLAQSNANNGEDNSALVETSDEREHLLADISGDGLPDLVATSFFGVSGSNSDYRQLFVFEQRDGALVPVDVGAADRGGLGRFSVKNGTLELVFLEHSDDDARCCPSLESRESYSIVSGSLVAQR